MNKKKYTWGTITILVLILIVLFVNSNVKKKSAQTDYTNIDANTLNEMMKSKDFKLINVHIPYAGKINGTDSFIAFNEIGEKINLPKDEKIVLYCRSGSMSRKAAEKLVSLGYTNVYNFERGMNEWKAQGFKLLNKDNNNIEKV